MKPVRNRSEAKRLSAHRLVLIPMHDEELSVRKIAMGLLGRLGRLNPSCAMPSFRKMLVQLLTQLEYNNEQTKKEESVELLTTLIRVSTATLAAICAAFLR